MPGPSPARVVVAVDITATEVLELDVRDEDWVTLQVQNLDAVETFRGYVERRQSTAMGWSLSTLGDFAGIPPAGSTDSDGNPTDSVTADLDVSGTGYIRIVGVMTGTGGDVAVCARKGYRK